jgi:hypothetical protein
MHLTQHYNCCIPKNISHSLTHGAEPFLRSHQLCRYSRTFQHFMEHEGSLGPSTGPYSEPHRSSPYHPILSKNIVTDIMDLKVAVFRDVMLCSLVDIHHCFRGTCYLCIQGKNVGNYLPDYMVLHMMLYIESFNFVDQFMALHFTVTTAPLAARCM